MTHQDNYSREELQERIHARLRSIAVGSYLFQSDLAQALGLNPTDLQAIHHIGQSPSGLSAGALATALRLTTGSTSVAIDRLVTAGFARRVPDPADGRGVRVVLRPDAQADIRARYGEVNRRIDTALETFVPSELAVLARFLDAVARSS